MGYWENTIFNLGPQDCGRDWPRFESHDSPVGSRQILGYERNGMEGAESDKSRGNIFIWNKTQTEESDMSDKKDLGVEEEIVVDDENE